MLITASWVDRIKELIHLQAVSPVWSDIPAWYFWISQISGAFCLELNETVSEKWDSDGLASGMFSLKCYPYVNGELFDGFSFEEQEFIKSNIFDHTHTPLFEEKNKIPDSLFNVAAIEMTTHTKDTLALFSLEALDSMQLYYSDKILQTYPVINKSRQYKAGEIARDVPGYDLGCSFLSCLLSLYSFYSRTKPVRVLLTRNPGFKCVGHTSNNYQCIDADDINIYSLHVLFSDHYDTDLNRGEKLIEQQFEASENNIIFDQKFTRGHLPCHHISPLRNTKLDKKWWSLAEADYPSNLTSNCGCEDCRH